jgi:5-methylcytosine-specific restriction endonuclease McrA
LTTIVSPALLMEGGARGVAIHLSWWVWALGALLLVVSAFEEQQRAARKARHRKYLRSPEWKARRKSALQRAGGRCMDCGATTNLHVRHLTYKRYGDELARDLRVLCSRCHRRRHGEGGRADDILDRLIGWIADARDARDTSD